MRMSSFQQPAWGGVSFLWFWVVEGVGDGRGWKHLPS